MGPPLDGLSGSYACAPCAANAPHGVLCCHSHEDDDRRAGRTRTAKRGPAIDRGGRSRVPPREVAGALRSSCKAGATPGNTILMDANDSAKSIDLKGANFDELLAKSNSTWDPRCPTAPERSGILSFDPRARCRPPLWPDGRAASRPVSNLRRTTGLPGRRAQVAIMRRGGRGER